MNLTKAYDEGKFQDYLKSFLNKRHDDFVVEQLYLFAASQFKRGYFKGIRTVLVDVIDVVSKHETSPIPFDLNEKYVE